MDPSLVRIIGNTGKEGKGENQFTQPRGVCVDNATKELFVVDCNNHRIQVYHLNSLAYIRQIGKGLHGDAPGSLNYPVGLCLDDRNQLFVADTNNHRIVVFNRVTGGHVRSIGSQGTARGCLYSPYGVCIDMYTNVLYVADYDNHRVQAFNKDTGEFIRIIGLGYGTEDGQMNQPIVVCIDYEMDYLLVADYSNNRVVVFDKESGSFIRHIGTGNGPNSLAGPRGLCICKEVNILFVADREHHRIQLYDKTTYERLRSIGGEQGTDPGQFFRPMEICVNVEEGVLIVVDGYNHRVQIIEIPELQSEKRRLKALAQSKADAELNGRAVPKPSVLAVFTQLAGQERVLVDPVTNGLRLRFDHLGPLYDVHLPSSDIPLLLAHLAALPIPVHTVYAPRESEGGVSSRKSSSPFHPAAVEPSPLTTPGSLTERQAGMFLSILESLCHHDPQTGQSESNEATAGAVSGDSPYLLVAPALFALHSLLDRGWRPARITPAVVTLLAGFLADIGSGIASEAERCKVLEAIVAVLRAGVSTSEEVMESVLSAVLECLSHPVRYVMQAEDIAAVASSNSTIGSSFSSFVETDNAAVMLAYFDILSAIFSQVCDQPGGSHSPDSKPATICMSTSTTNASTSSKFLTPVISRVSSKVSLPCTPGAGGTGGGAGPCSASAASAHERRKHTSELRKDVLDFLFGVPFMFHLQDNRKTGSGGTKPVENESNRTLTIPLLTATSPATNMVTALPREVSVHDHPAFAMHPHIGAQVAAAGSTTATTATAASSATSISQQDTNTGTSTGAAVGIVVPTGLSSFISAAYLIRKLRHAQRSFSLGELSDKSRMLFAGDLLKSTSAQELEHGQIQLFRAASQYFHNMRSTGGGGGLSGAALAKRSRGGRNIWRPTEPLALGDLVDAQDKEKCWFESIVQEILEDGSIRVHFMGWGSKWDDTITGAELTERLAPLNTKTKNWRADLFQGGLIEIKCNDDPVNQKWMWGRITALNVEEAWVEVSYLFSNEPTVVKRAWLFGETICPVGMHTKEKSKAAAALLVKPLKKVEDIIRERAEEALPGDEAMFFDKADDLDESLLLIEGDSLKMSPTPTSCVPPVVLDLHGGYKRSGGAPHHAIGYVGVVLLEW